MKTRNRKGFLDESVLPKGWARQNPLIRGQGQPKICKKNSMSIIFCQTPINSGPSPPPQKWQWGFQWILMPAHKMGFQRVHCSALRCPLQALHHWQPLLGARWTLPFAVFNPNFCRRDPPCQLITEIVQQIVKGRVGVIISKGSNHRAA